MVVESIKAGTTRIGKGIGIGIIVILTFPLKVRHIVSRDLSNLI